jgi:protein-tyrosine-phosphatase/tRNA A37 threonylcarbamoyladenosine synthetase subunit TsaC/SUA5/YrdC
MNPPLAPNVLTPTSQNLHNVAKLIQSGKLVIVPTETIYGIAVNLLSPEAREAAREIKGVPPGQPGAPWVVHVGQPEDVLAWAPGLSSMGRRLVSKALPGPVAFQIRLNETDLAAARDRLKDAADETLQDGYLTIRCPDASPTQQVLSEASTNGGAIAIIGAGTPAQPGIYELSDLPEAILNPETAATGRVAAAIDGGPTRYKRSSTLVRLSGDAFSIVRPGVIDERIIQKMADFQILFICSGNTCRSPMAAALAAKMLADKLGISPSELPLRHIVVQSAGLHANRGLRAAREAVEALSAMKTDLSSHISQPATIDLLRRADLIYTMTEAHREEVVELVPAAAQKTYRLDPQGDVEDPIGSGLSVYQEVAHRLVELLQHRLSELPL